MATWPPNDATDWNTTMLAYLAVDHETDGTHKAANLGYIDRGDPAAADYGVGDLTTDGTWRDLDLGTDVSVPSGAKAVALVVTIKDEVAGNVIRFRENGNSDEATAPAVYMQAVNVTNSGSFTVSVDSSQIIEYNASNTTWTTIDITVLGWFL